MPTLDELLVRSRDLNSELSANICAQTSINLNNSLSPSKNLNSSYNQASNVPILQTLPKIDRDLSQVMEAGRKLWESLGSPTDFSNEQKAKAALILNKNDTNFILPSKSKKLQKLLKSTDLAPLDPCKDLDQLLNNERENSILKLIEKSNKISDNLVFNKTTKSILNKWNTEKMHLINQNESENYNFNETYTKNSSFFENSNTSFDNLNLSSKKFNQNSKNASFSSVSKNKFKSLKNMNLLEKCFAQILQENILNNFLNSVIIEKEKLSQISRKINNLLPLYEENYSNSNIENIMDLWEILNHVLNNTKNIQKLQKKAIHGAGIDYLEHRFRNVVESVIKNDSSVLLKNKSLPTTKELVMAYVRYIEKSKRISPNDLQYAYIYYSLRMGDIDAAIEFSDEPLASALADWRSSSISGYSSSNYNISQNENNFASSQNHDQNDKNEYSGLYINKANQKLSVELENNFNLEYKQIYRSMPYYGCVLCVIGCGNVNDDFSQVTSSSECWLWLNMHQIQQVDGDFISNKSPDSKNSPNKSNLLSNFTHNSSARKSFSNFQTSIVTSSDGTSIMENFLDKPITYVKLLLLSQQYEVALSVLNKLGDNIAKIHVPHLAICLNDSKLLDIDSSVYNYGKSIINYCSKWKLNFPEYAIHYYYNLQNLPDSLTSTNSFNNTSTLFHECISNLIFEGIDDKTFNNLFNQNNGQIYKLLSIQEAHTLFSKSARDCEKNGRLELAIKLYEIANDYNNCCDLLIDGMSNGKSNLFKYAQDFSERVTIEVLENNTDNLETLLLVMDTTQLMEKLNTAEKLPILKSKMLDIASFEIVSLINIIPMTIESVSECTELFRIKPETVRASFPKLLVAIMKLYARLSNTTPEEKRRLKAAANALVVFSGRITYRTSASINAQLVHLQLSV